jgi:hypothetical protein
VGHTAYKIAEILEKPEEGPKLMKDIGKFFFIWAAVVVLAALTGHYAMGLKAAF